MNEQNMPQYNNQPEQPPKNLEAIITVIAITALITGSSVYAWQNTNLKTMEQALQQQISDLRNQVEQFQKTAKPATTQELAQQPTQPNIDQQQTVKPTDEAISWKTYQSDKYGFSFSYPSNFKIVTDKIQVEYIGHPKGFNWYRIELTDTSVSEKPFMRFEVDPDGYGPFFPDRTYQISEDSLGKVIIGTTKNYSSENTDDGKVLIIPSILESGNGHSYYWQFSFGESGQDYESLFKQILSTFKFAK